MPSQESSILLLAGRLEVRGRTSQLLHLVRRLPDEGFKVRLLCPNASPLGREATQGLPIREAPAIEWPVLRFAAWHWLLWELAANPPDLIHIFQRRLLPFGTWLARKLRRPYVITFHDFLRPGETLAIDNVLCRRYLAVSEPIRDELFTQPRYPQELIEVFTVAWRPAFNTRRPSCSIQTNRPSSVPRVPSSSTKGTMSSSGPRR